MGVGAAVVPATRLRGATRVPDILHPAVTALGEATTLRPPPHGDGPQLGGPHKPSLEEREVMLPATLDSARRHTRAQTLVRREERLLSLDGGLLVGVLQPREGALIPLPPPATAAKPAPSPRVARPSPRLPRAEGLIPADGATEAAPLQTIRVPPSVISILFLNRRRGRDAHAGLCSPPPRTIALAPSGLTQTLVRDARHLIGASP